MPATTYESWGRVRRNPQRAVRLHERPRDLRPLAAGGESMLPYGNGRSYGDSCLNPAGVVLDTRGLDNFLAFDDATGVVRCEAGVLLADILQVLGPRGWFLPVTPGTQYVTVGGCIANDVHGKNHHKRGTFGEHVVRFELLRSDGSRRVCSREEHPEWFAATVGGLGLTGLITWAEVRLLPVPGLRIYEESLRFDGLDGFFDIAADSDRRFEYTVAWIDCMARGRALGRGLFFRGEHAPGRRPRGAGKESALGLPLTPPCSLVSKPFLKIFNEVYYRRQRGRVHAHTIDYEGFFYPLDGIRHWNRLYGPRGFMQYQCVVPHEGGRASLHALLQRIAASGAGSFLGVLKNFGAREPVGLLSFPREGVTLALDFPYRGQSTEALFRKLDAIVLAAGGALYPAKDARMPSHAFRASYPSWTRFGAFIDPRFESAFLRRVHGGAAT